MAARDGLPTIPSPTMTGVKTLIGHGSRRRYESVDSEGTILHGVCPGIRVTHDITTDRVCERPFVSMVNELTAVVRNQWDTQTIVRGLCLIHSDCRQDLASHSSLICSQHNGVLRQVLLEMTEAGNEEKV